MTQGRTPFWHQVRDQSLHMVYGSVAGLAAGSGAFWWQGIAAAGVYGAIREGEQWHTLNTPSWTDSLLDWSFVCLGGAIGAACRHFLMPN